VAKSAKPVLSETLTNAVLIGIMLLPPFLESISKKPFIWVFQFIILISLLVIIMFSFKKRNYS
ncbi:MAG: hypothetical protein PHU16_02660, partial [Atribacterota bacterium]|jgi:hypothetical protein|nr:hypothetical protein [Atribacterota bacterium]